VSVPCGAWYMHPQQGPTWRRDDVVVSMKAGRRMMLAASFDAGSAGRAPFQLGTGNGALASHSTDSWPSKPSTTVIARAITHAALDIRGLCR